MGTEVFDLTIYDTFNWYISKLVYSLKVPPHHILACVPLSTTLSGGKADRQEESVKRAIRQAELSQQSSLNLLEHPL